MAKTKTFEEQISELEEIVKKLENGDAPLDEAVSLFEQGMKLSVNCYEALDKAEQKIKVFTENKDGTATEETFEGGEDA